MRDRSLSPRPVATAAPHEQPSWAAQRLINHACVSIGAA